MSKKQPSGKTGVASKKLELASDVSPEELEIFLQEASEQLQLLDEDIVKLEKGEEDSNLLQEIFRAAHTLKGSSGMLGHQRMAQLTHAMESVLDRLRKGTLQPSASVVDALLASLDVLKTLNQEIITREMSDVDLAPVISGLEKVQQEAVPPQTEHKKVAQSLSLEQSLNEEEKQKTHKAMSQGRGIFKVEVTLSKEIEWPAVRCFQVLRDLSTAGDVIASEPSQAAIEAEKAGLDLAVIYASDKNESAITDQVSQILDVDRVQVTPLILEDVEPLLETSPAVATSPLPQLDNKDSSNQPKALSHEAVTSQTVRVAVQRLDDLMTIVGELAIAHPRIHQLARVLESRYKDDEVVKALGETSTNAMKIVNELQEDVMKIRMLPIGTVFNTLPRMVRDLARKADKEIEFIVEGQDTEIDRTVIDHIRDPIVHLLRNAVDHGIEPPQQRVAAGKPRQGTVRLAAWHEQGHIIICSEDDGGGIDPYEVKQCALKKGIITPEVASKMSEQEATELIFVPGLSTAKKTTEVSGRGVGLDVVRKNIEAMNGVVLVDTRRGEGTRFTLRMPLTLATFQGLLVSSANTIYAIPLASVTEAMKLRYLETRTVEDGEIMRIRNNLMPLLRLRKAFSIGEEGMGREDYVVVVRDSTRSVGLAVDAIMEPQEVVVKSLGQFMSDVKGIAGASILGDGTVALIMDVPTMIRSTLGR